MFVNIALIPDQVHFDTAKDPEVMPMMTFENLKFVYSQETQKI